jgi:putative AdoMet-dependent methyltransferase
MNIGGFNHDRVAARYDADVTDESHPIRAGYAKALRWLGSCVPNGSRVLDLGSGTGNAILALPADCRVVAVDVSTRMIEIARTKLSARDVEYVVSGIIEFFELRPAESFDAVVSSYAIHHLADVEKVRLFSRVKSALQPGGCAVFVDLMYANESGRTGLIEKYHNRADVAGSIEEEFYWNIDSAVTELTFLGFRVDIRQFTDLSWGILARST